MRKSTIWILAIVLAFTFLGLLYLQIYYMTTMIEMRKEQFAQSVSRVLYSVSRNVEYDETRRYLFEDLAENELRNKPNTSDVLSSVHTTINHTLSVTGEDGKISNFSFSERKIFTPKRPQIKIEPQKSINSVTRTFKGMQEVLRNQYLYQKGLLDEVVLNILNESGSLPILERLDARKIDSYMRAELQNNGLSIPFEFAVVSTDDRNVYASTGYNEQSGNEIYTQVLFPNDAPKKLNYLKAYFPTQRQIVFSSIRFMIPSFIFTIVMLIIFIATIIVIFRQKQLSEMKNDFINNMTHEFKTPISTISLAAQMLNDPVIAKEPTMFNHIAIVINDETKRLRFQVEKVLQMSMFDRQKTMLKLTTIDANDLVAGVLSTFKLKVERFGGEIEAQLDAEDAFVMVDEMHFTNVVFNLLDNAVKYSREDVPLKLSVRTSTEKNNFELSIQDNGIGIRKEDLKKIFEKFYRVSTGNRHDVKGFGLGLAYVYKIVADLKGTIRAESELNVGTKFIINLPLIKND